MFVRQRVMYTVSLKVFKEGKRGLHAMLILKRMIGWSIEMHTVCVMFGVLGEGNLTYFIKTMIIILCVPYKVAKWEGGGTNLQQDMVIDQEKFRVYKLYSAKQPRKLHLREHLVWLCESESTI